MDWSATLNQSLAAFPRPELPSDIRLPILPNVVTEFSKKADDPNVSARQLAAVVEVDAGLTMELLKHVNSTAIGLKRKAVTPQQAISLLGISQSKLFLLTRGLRMSLSGLKNNRAKAILNVQKFWNTNLERALFAREVAGILKADAEVSFAAAMMQDLMLPVLIDGNLEVYQDHLARSSEAGVPLTETEREKLGYDHAVAAAFLMKDWSFPDNLICSCLHHHGGEEMVNHETFGRTAVAAVAVASLLPDSLGQTCDGLGRLIQLEESLKGFRLQRVAAIVDDHFAELSDGEKDRTPLTQRVEESLAAVGSNA